MAMFNSYASLQEDNMFRSVLPCTSTLRTPSLRRGHHVERSGLQPLLCWSDRDLLFSMNWFKGNSDTGWWLTYPSEKWRTSSVGMIIPFPTEWKVIKAMFQTTNQDIYGKPFVWPSSTGFNWSLLCSIGSLGFFRLKPLSWHLLTAQQRGSKVQTPNNSGGLRMWKKRGLVYPLVI
jgi:hypothetical protein